MFEWHACEIRVPGSDPLSLGRCLSFVSALGQPANQANLLLLNLREPLGLLDGFHPGVLDCLNGTLNFAWAEGCSPIRTSNPACTRLAYPY